MSQINKPTDYFNTLTYTGNGVGGTNITGVGFQPDLVWIKRRSGVENHVWNDAVRGVPNNIYSSLTNAEDSGDLMSAILSDGFTVETDPSVNSNTDTYVAWNWKANGTGASNTDGSITSTVSANTTSGFSIVSYTGNATNSTVGHELGVAPKMIIFKNRTVARNWISYHDSIGATKFMYFNLTNAEQTDSTAFNNTAPTSSVFSLGSNVGGNESGSSMIAYCFAEKKGFSKFGSYTGNGSTDGTFVYTGFKPAWFMTKKINVSGENWNIQDNTRSAINPVTNELVANISDAEYTAGSRGDFLSNGFKLRTTSGGYNNSGSTYIYMCFAESPLVGTNNTPATAR